MFENYSFRDMFVALEGSNVNNNFRFVIT